MMNTQAGPLTDKRVRRLPEGELPSATQHFAGCPFLARCPLAADICADTPPPFIGLGSKQFARCHYPYGAPHASPGD